MFGIGLLVGLGRRLLAGAVADTGLLPAGYYRHRVLSALEEEDFEGALEYLQWAGEPLLMQILVLRLRLLKARHEKQRQTLIGLLDQDPPPAQREKARALLSHQDLALAVLGKYEGEAIMLLRRGLGM